MRRIALTAIGLLALTPAVASAENGTVARGWPVLGTDGIMVAAPWGGPVLYHDWTDWVDPWSMAAYNLNGTTRWKNGALIEGGISQLEWHPLMPFGLQANGMFGPARNDYLVDSAGVPHHFGRRIPLASDLFASATTGSTGFDVTLSHTDGTQVWQHHEAGSFEFGDRTLIDGGATLVFSSNGTLLALNRATGQVKWQVPHASPSYRYATDGIVANVTGRGLVAYDAAGAELASVPPWPAKLTNTTSDGLTLQPATVNGRYGLNAVRPDATIAWRYSTTQPVKHVVPLPDGTVAVTTTSLTTPGFGHAIVTRINPKNPRLRAPLTTITLSRTKFRTVCDPLWVATVALTATCQHDAGRGAILRIASPKGTTMSVRFKGAESSTWTSMPVPAGNSFTRVDWIPGSYTMQVRRGTTGPIIRSIPVTITK